MFRLLRNARKAYKQWRSLPAEEQERYAGEIRHITALVRELGGSGAVQFVEGSADAAGDDVDARMSTAKRDRTVVMAELQDATTSLLTALAGPAADLATRSTPRSMRIGGKLAAKGVRRYINRAES